jgi:putative endonuclease
MPSFVYVLGCRTPDRILTYVGWTTDIARRLAQHNGGIGARTTRGRAWILLHTEKFRTRRQAMSREWYLKRDRKFRKLLAQGCGALEQDSTQLDRFGQHWVPAFAGTNVERDRRTISRSSPRKRGPREASTEASV